MPAVSISVAGATLNEIGAPDSFITVGSGGLSSPFGLTLGPDGNVYVASNGGAVLRYNGTTGAFMNTFVSQGSGGLGFGNTASTAGLAFGPDGNLYVTSGSTNQVLEYSGNTGAFITAFVPAGSGGLNFPTGVTFGPDGNLYVTSFSTNAILRYQGPLHASPGSPLPASGQSGATFVVSSSGGLLYPNHILFGPDGNLYADGGQTHGILRYNGTTGAFLDAFAPSQNPAEGDLGYGRGMVFDQDGRLYVTDGADNVLRYDSQGNYVGAFLVDSVSSAIAKPRGMIFDAQGNLLIACLNNNTVERYDRGVAVSLSAPSSTPVSVSYTTADGSALAGTNYVAQSGTVTFAPGQTSREILLATQEDLQAPGNVAFSVQLSNPTGGATIASGTATVNVIVDATTRQFAVADTATIEGDHTAHYRGAFVQGMPGNGFSGLAFGSDGYLYTLANWQSGVPYFAMGRFNATTGAFIGPFGADHITNVGGRIMVHAGYLYQMNGSEVDRWDTTTGIFAGVFVANGSGGLVQPSDGAFGPDGNLYLTSGNAVLRYDGTTGAPLGAFVASGSGGLSGADDLAFDPSGSYLYVSGGGSNQVLKYSASTGSYVGVAAGAGLSGPSGIAFGPDGLLYVLSSGNDRILRFTESGAYGGDYVSAGSGGLSSPRSLAFGPNGDLYVSCTASLATSQIMDFGTENEAVFTVTNTTPSTLPLTVNYATADGTAIAGTNYTATSGTLTFAPGWTTATIAVPTLDSGSQTAPLTFALNLSSPVGGSLARGQATGTIAPSDGAAKFYVVNDATSSLGGTNTAFKYQSSGAAQAPFNLSLNDLSPMGVAANASGTTEWVVDANKNVYVYSPGGTLLGSWSAGGLSSSATLTGIATNGTDLWLVDSYADKVYKYTGAASRLSGSQNAASSFKLNRSDTNPQDIVTDGTSLWVVDGSALKVFKYTLSGSLLGSWTIDPADTHPTGITINPNNVSDIWIVDSGTDKVYQYVGATSRTSGSQNAAATFALAAGNTNPQGIADPPTQDMLATFPSSGGSTMAAIPSPASHDAVFAQLAQLSVQGTSAEEGAHRSAARHAVPAHHRGHHHPILAAHASAVRNRSK
jgi:sugar lactone lactonase YvrE